MVLIEKNNKLPFQEHIYYLTTKGNLATIQPVAEGFLQMVQRQVHLQIPYLELARRYVSLLLHFVVAQHFSVEAVGVHKLVPIQM